MALAGNSWGGEVSGAEEHRRDRPICVVAHRAMATRRRAIVSPSSATAQTVDQLGFMLHEDAANEQESSRNPPAPARTRYPARLEPDG